METVLAHLAVLVAEQHKQLAEAQAYAEQLAEQLTAAQQRLAEFEARDASDAGMQA